MNIRVPFRKGHVKAGSQALGSVVTPRFKKKQLVEALEQRVLLSADINPAAQAGLVDGLQDMQQWAATLVEHNELDQVLPGLNQSLGGLVDVPQLLSQIITPIEDYFNNLSPNQQGNTDAIVTLLDDLMATSDTVTGDLIGDEFIFDVHFEPSRAITDVPIDLDGSLTGIDLEMISGGTLSGNVGLDLDFEFGYNTVSGEFFIRVAQFDLTSALTTNSMTLDARLGFLDVSSTGGSFSLGGDVALGLVDPDNSDGLAYISGTELTNTPINTLLTSAWAGNANLSLPLTSTLLAGTPTLTVNWVDSSAPGTLTSNVGSTGLYAKFAKFTSGDVNNWMGNFSDWFANLENDDLLGKAIPILGDQLADIIDPVGSFRNLLVDSSASHTVDSYVAWLQASPSVSSASSSLVGDQLLIDITFSLDKNSPFKIQWQDAATLDLDIDVSGGQLSTSLSGSFQFGIDLSAAQPELYLVTAKNDVDLTASASISIADLDVSGHVGALGVDITNGSATLSATLEVDLFDPFEDGRISHGDVSNFVDNFEDYQDATLTGTASLDLPFSADLFGTPINETLNASWADVGDLAGVSANLGSLTQLKKFSDVGLDSLTGGMSSVGDVLGKLFGSGGLDIDMPLLGNQWAELASPANILADLVSGMPEFTDLQGLKTALESFSDGPVNVTQTGTEIEFRFSHSSTLDTSISAMLRETLLGAELSADLEAMLSGTVTTGLAFGIDLREGLAADQRFYWITGNTQTFIDVAFKVLTTNPLVATASFGYFSAGINGGTIAIAGRTSGNVDTNKNATAFIGTTGGGGKVTLRDWVANPANYIGSASFNGGAHVTLPLEATGVGSTTVDFEWDSLTQVNTEQIFDSNALLDFLPDPASFLGGGQLLDGGLASGLAQLGEMFGTLADGFDANDWFQADLPIINQSLAELMDLDGLFTDIKDKILGLLVDGANTDSFKADVTAALLTLTDVGSGLTASVDADRTFAGLLDADDPEALSWLGFIPGSDRLLYNVNLTLDQILADTSLTLESGNAVGATLEALADLGIKLTLDITFGYDKGANVDTADAFFFRVNKLDIELDVNATLDADADVAIGLAGATVNNGSFNLDTALSFGLNNLSTNPSGVLTLNELRGTSAGALLKVDVVRDVLSANLPLSFAVPGLASGTAKLTINGEAFDPANLNVAFTGSSINEVNNFSSFSAADLAAGFRQISGWLSSLSGEDILDTAIPFAGISIGEALDLGEAFAQQFESLLYGPDGELKFSTTDGLSELFNSLSVKAGGTALPVDGVLSADATFNLQIDGGALVPVTITAAITSDNVTPEDLILDINAALPVGYEALLSSDGYLIVRLVDLPGSSFTLSASELNAAVTELGLLVTQSNGIDIGGLVSSYNASTDLLTYTLTLDHRFANVDADFAFNLDLAPLGGFQTDAQLKVTADGQLQLVFGFDLSPNGTQMTANRPLPASGSWASGSNWQLAAGQDAQFELLMQRDGADATEIEVVPVVISALATAGLASEAEFLAVVNEAIAYALQNAGIPADTVVAEIYVDGADHFLRLNAQGEFASSFSLSTLPSGTGASQLGFGSLEASSIVVVTAAGAALPTNGSLSGDATFMVTVNGFDAGSVTVTSAATAENDPAVPAPGDDSPVQALVADVNRALITVNDNLTAEGLPNIIAEVNRDGALKFSAVGVGVEITILAAANDPAITELGLATSQQSRPTTSLQFASSSIIDQVFVKSLSFGGSAEVSGLLDATASFGLIDITIGDPLNPGGVGAAALGFTATANVGLNFGSPKFLDDLYTALDTVSFTGGIGGTASIAFPVAIDTAITGLGSSANMTIANGTNIFDSAGWSVVTDGDLLDFSDVSVDSVLQLLRDMLDILEGMASETLLSQNIPLVDIKLSDALELIDIFAAALIEIEKNPAQSLDQIELLLEDALTAALGDISGDYVQVYMDGTDLRIDLSYATILAPQNIQLNMDLENMGLGAVDEIPGVGNIVSASSSGDLQLEGGASFTLNLGIDLSTPAAPRSFIHNSSSIDLEFLLKNTSPLNFTVALGPLGVFIKNGSVAIAADPSNPINPATLHLGLDAGTTRHYLDTLVGSLGSNFASYFDYGSVGGVLVDLPVCFPTELDSHGSFQVNIPDFGQFFDNLFTGSSVGSIFSSPDFSTDFNLGNLFDSFEGILDGIDLILAGLQDLLSSGVFNIDLPLLGDGLAAASFIEDMRLQLAAERADILIAIDAATAPIDELRLQLFNILGPLVDENDGNAGITPDDIMVMVDVGAGLVDYAYGSAAPVLTDIEAVDFDLALGGEWGEGVGIDFDIGLPGLGFEFAAGSAIEAMLDWTFNFGFGVNRTDGFYLKTDDVNPELEATLTVALAAEFEAIGRFGLLDVLITPDADGGSLGYSADFDVNFGTGGANYTLNDILAGDLFDSVDVDFNAASVLDINLDFLFGFGFDNSGGNYVSNGEFPSIKSDFHFAWDTSLTSNNTTVEFNNWEVNLGEFFSDIFEPVVGPLRLMLEPIMPLLDLLVEPIDLVVYETSLLEIAQQFGVVENADTWESMISLSQFLLKIEQGLGPGFISMGDFKLTEIGVPGSLDLFALGSIDLNDPIGQLLGLFDSIDIADIETALRGLPGGIGLDDAKGSIGDWFEIPLYEDFSTSIIGLLFGKDVDLITFDTPVFTTGAKATLFETSFPTPLPGLFIDFYAFAAIEASFQFGFGFDTRGIRAVIDDEPLADILNGFYFDDHLEGGVDGKEVEITGTVGVGGAANIVIARGGVEGGLYASVFADFRDGEGEDEPDGKVYLDEFYDNMARGGVFCALETGGALGISIELFADIRTVDWDGFSWSRVWNDVTKIPIFEFGGLDCDTVLPDLATLESDGTLNLNIGTRANLRGAGTGLETSEEYFIEQVAPGVVKISAFGYEVYYGGGDGIFVEKIVGLAGSDKDTIIIDSPLQRTDKTLMDVRLDGGDDDDVLRTSGTNDLLIGGRGNDLIDSGAGDDVVYANRFGQQGSDAGEVNTIVLGDGDDIAYGALGADDIRGEVGADTIYGGGGDDRLYGGFGDDSLFGGSGRDMLFGQDDSDALYGEAGTDIISGGSGQDTIYGDGVAGTYSDTAFGLYGAVVLTATNDYLFGDYLDSDDLRRAGVYGALQAAFSVATAAQFADDLRSADIDNEQGQKDFQIIQFDIVSGDKIYAQGGDDFVSAQAGDDLIQGNAGQDFVYAGSGEDKILGGSGADTLHGDAGVDKIYGETGNDRIFGDGDDDFLYGQADDDKVYGGAGNDLILGGAGADLARGQEGNDTISGGLGIDRLYGDSGADLISGDESGDKLYGGSGNDELRGNVGDDTLYGHAGDDRLFGGLGDDDAHGGHGEDYLDGQEGEDSLYGDADNDLILGGTGIHNQLFGGSGDDRLIGSDEGSNDGNFNDSNFFGDLLEGGEGNDELLGMGGADVLLGGPGLDVIRGGNHGDYIEGGEAIDQIFGGRGNDEIYGFGAGAGDDAADDELYGNAGSDLLTGGGGRDYIDGGIGNDELLGAGGRDELWGGGGNDILRGGDHNDVLHGSIDGNDQLFGDAGHDLLYGYEGNDELHGGAGRDVLEGGAGDDLLTGGADEDILTGGADHDLLYGFSVTGVGDDDTSDRLYGDFGTNLDEAGSGRDQLFGQGGSDFLFGEGDDDLLAGGTGANEVIDYGSGEAATEGDFVAPTATAALVPYLTEASVSPVELAAADNQLGAWAGLAGGAGGGGLAGSSLAQHAVIATANGSQYVAWADSDGSSFDIYVAEQQGGSWAALGGSLLPGGISQSYNSTRNPSITTDASGAPVVAWTQANGGSTDIYAQRYNSSSGQWENIGSSAQLTSTGSADNAQLALVNGQLALLWLDDSSGTQQVYGLQYNGSSWVDTSTDSSSGGGISNEAADVESFALAQTSNRIAIAYEFAVGDDIQLRARQWGGANWATLNPGPGLGDAGLLSREVTLAYHNGDLHAAWKQQQPDLTSRIVIQQHTGSNWVQLDSIANTEAAHDLQLAVANNTLQLLWLDYDNKLAEQRDSLLLMEYDGNQFVEPQPGFGTDQGIDGQSEKVSHYSVATDAIGNTFLAWNQWGEDDASVFVRANDNTVSTTVADGTPGNTVADLLAANSYGVGDIIQVTGNQGGFTVSSADAGVTIMGAPGVVVSGNIIIDGGASAVVLQNISVAGTVTINGANNINLRGNTLGGGIMADGADGLIVASNTIDGSLGLELRGDTSDILVERNTFTASNAIEFSTTGTVGAVPYDNVIVRHNEIRAPLSGITLAASVSGVIEHNDIAIGSKANASRIGLDILADFSGVISDNKISGAFTGVNYAASAALAGNDIFDNNHGVVSSVLDSSTALGFVAGSASNDIHHNNNGVQLVNARVQGQHIHDNTDGVVGDGIVGGESLDTANLILGNQRGVNLSSGTVQYSRIGLNGTGIVAGDKQHIHHNEIYRNANYGIYVNGADDVRITYNTLHAVAGDNVHLTGGATRVELTNNILWAESGYDLYVSDDSRAGFYSDYNLMHVSGSGTMVHYILDFNDILDWQVDVNRFDLHSRGYTVVDPQWSTPRFSDRGYSTAPTVAGQRDASPAVDLGDVINDIGQPTTHVNLLSNPGFENGITGWAVNSTATTANNPAYAHEGGNYFSAGNTLLGFAEQTINLFTAGYDAGQIAAGNLELMFSGRIRSGDTAAPDHGRIELRFLDSSQLEIGTAQADSINASDRWELVGGQVVMPAGTQFVEFRFLAERASSTPNQAYLDRANVSVVENSNLPDVGATGASAVDHATDGMQLTLRDPDLYVDWERAIQRPITWDSVNLPTSAGVRIELIQDVAGGQIVLAIIANNVPNNGLYDQWRPQDSSIPFGTEGLRLRITLANNPLVFSQSLEAFSVPVDGTDYYVDDRDDTGDVYSTSADGSNRNTGKTADAPKPLPTSLLRIYDLVTGDTLYMDAGNYQLFDPLRITGDPDPVYSVDEGFSIVGAADVNGPLSHITMALAGYNPQAIIEIDNADFVSISNLSITGGIWGIWGHNTADNLTFDNIRVDAVNRGVYLDASDNTTISNSTFINNAQEGVYLLGGSTALLDSNTFESNLTGLRTTGTNVTVVDSAASLNDKGFWIVGNNAIVQRNTAFDNIDEGFVVSSSGGLIGDSDLSQGNGNLAHDNFVGMVTTNVIVAGNVIFDNAEDGLRLNSGAAINNVIYGNMRGIDATQTVDIIGNRIYANTNYGVVYSWTYNGYSLDLADNVIYSNTYGVYFYGRGNTSVDARNNLIYDNSGYAFRLRDGSGSQLDNNTIYQPEGNGLLIDTNASNVNLRDNIFHIELGTAITVDPNSQLGFSSDYNIFDIAPAAFVGNWQSVPISSLQLWSLSIFDDKNSLEADPDFVDPLGADGTLGYVDVVSDGRDDDFHLQSLYDSFHGGALAPVLDDVTGLPLWLTPTPITDAAQSVAIDRGDGLSDFSNEPVPSGGYVNIGAYGNTAQASHSPTQYLFVLSPNGGETLAQDTLYDIHWRSFGFSGDVDLLISGDDGATYVSLAAGEANDGLYTLAVDNTFLVGEQYKIQVQSVDVPAVIDDSDAVFSIISPITEFYVNDTFTAGDEYATAIGSDLNDGLSAATPMASIRAVLDTYDLDPGDVILVDTGDYTLTTNILIELQDSGVEIRGPVDPGSLGHEAVLNRGNTNTGNYVIQFGTGVTDVTLSNLSITGGQIGVYAPNTTETYGITVVDSHIYDNLNYGIYAYSGGDWTLENLQVHGHAADGAYIYDIDNPVITGGEYYGNTDRGIEILYGIAAHVDGTEFYSNRYGLSMTTANGIIENVSVHDNTSYGILVDGRANGTRIEVRDSIFYDNGQRGISAVRANIYNNEVWGHTVASASYGGIFSGGYTTISDNVVHENYYGIRATGIVNIVENNQVYGNLGSGIYTTNHSTTGHSNTVRGNTVYSNVVGIYDRGYNSGYYGSLISNNLIYANTDIGVDVANSKRSTLINNTIYQPVGDAVYAHATFSNLELINNVLWVDQGNILRVDSTASAGFSAENNLYYRGVNAGLVQLANFSGTNYQDLAAWQAFMPSDASSVEPLFSNGVKIEDIFIDIDGVDGILGLDSGLDDNFGLTADSPGIDAANSYDAPFEDLLDRPRKDDLSTPNTGDGWELFVEAGQGSSSYTADGVAKNWRSTIGNWNYTLPFAFTLYGETYNSVYVTSNGFLQFGSAPVYPYGNTPTQAEFENNVRIAPLWDNLSTSGAAGNDIYIDESVANQVTIRWQGYREGNNNEVNFAVTLFDDGSFRFDYGTGNDGITPIVGVSGGNGITYVLSSYNGLGNLPNANSLLFTPQAGLNYFDIGAFEFQGDSNDAIPPYVVDVTPLPANNGSTALAFNAITVNFSEPLDVIAARTAANYELMEAGVDGIFDTADDPAPIAITASYSFPETNLGLLLDDGLLADGYYRLTLFGGRAILDTAANPLDGNQDGTGGDDYVHVFTVDRTTNIAPTADDQTVNVDEDGSILVVMTASDDDGDTLSFGIISSPTNGALSGFGPGTVPGTYEILYTPNPGYNGPDSFMFQVDDGKTGTGVGTIILDVGAVNDQPTLDSVVTQNLIEGEALSLFLVGDDVDTGDTLTYSLESGPVGASVDGVTGEFTWTATDGIDSYPVTVRVTDDNADDPLFAEQSFSINVTDVAPTLTISGDASVETGATYTLALGVTDPGDDTITQWNINWGDGSGVETVTGNLNSATHIYSTIANVNISATATNEDGTFSSNTLALDVQSDNDQPTLDTIANQNLIEGEALSVSLVGADINVGDTLTYSLVSGPVGASVDGVTGEFTWTATDGAASYPVTVRVTDDGADLLFAEQNFSIDVSDVAPTLTISGDASVEIGATYTLALGVTDPGDDTISQWDVDWGDGSAIETVVGDPGSATHVYSTIANVNISATATNEDDTFSSNTLALNVLSVNDQPTLDTIVNQNLIEGEALSVSLLGADINVGDTLTYSLVSGPVGASVNGSTGEFTWTATDGLASYPVTVRVTDDGAGLLFAEQSFSIDVTDVAPTLTISGDASVEAGATYTLALGVTDPGDDTIIQWDIDWGDGSGIETIAGNLNSATHVYSTIANVNISATATNEDSTFSSNTVAVAVTDPVSLKVISSETDSSGVGIRFNEAIDPTLLNLYDTETAGFGAADAVLIGDTAGIVAGSLILDDDGLGLRFVATGGPLVSDNYTLTLTSAAGAFINMSGELLDGDANDAAGADYLLNFSVANNGPVISIGDVVRGPGQAVDLPVADNGIPITLSDGTGINDISFTLDYDPTLLNVANVINGAALPGGAVVNADTSTPGQVIVTISSTTGFSAGGLELIRLETDIPEDAPYSSKALLNMHTVLLNSGALPVTVDDGIQVVAYLGDTTGNHAYASLDGQNILRNVVGLDTGFEAYPLVDPVLVGDITGNGALSGLDGNRIFQYVQGLNPAQIPVLPSLAGPIVVGGLDPTITIGSVSAAPGETVTIAVDVDTIPAGLNGVELWIQYDVEQIELLSVDPGTIPQNFDFFYADASTPGLIRIDTSNLSLVDAPDGGSLLILEFRVRDDATGNAILDLQRALLNDGHYTLTPEPIFGPDDSDGLVEIVMPLLASKSEEATESEESAETEIEELIDTSVDDDRGLVVGASGSSSVTSNVLTALSSDEEDIVAAPTVSNTWEKTLTLGG